MKPDLTPAKILEAAKAFLAKNERWPSAMSGDATPYFGYPETWSTVNTALREGKRGLPGGSTLAMVLDNARNPPGEPPEQEILDAARRFHARTGRWPS